MRVAGLLMAGNGRRAHGFALLVPGFVFLVLMAFPLHAATAAVEDPPTFVLKWGSTGSGDGQFIVPVEIDVDSAGNVYVTDYSNARVQKFDGSGNFLTQWGTYGAGNGQFAFPEGIAADSAGYVYVTETYNRRVQKFNVNGTFLTNLAAYGTGDGQVEWTLGVTVDSAGNVYVADTYNYRIQKFDRDGYFLRKWGAHGTGDGQFDIPYDVAVDSAGNVYVADYGNHRIQKFDGNGDFLTKWGAFGSGDGQFVYPWSVAVDSAGNVYVTDASNDRVQKFDGSGNFLTQWGTYGAGDGQFNNPEGIAVDSEGNVYVVDVGNNRVQKFAPALGQTPPGNNVSVTPVEKEKNSLAAAVKIKFDTVTAGGKTEVGISSTGTPPDGFKPGDPSLYYDISTTAQFEGNIEICIDYSNVTYNNEERLRLFHKVDAVTWKDVTTSVDQSKKIICGRDSSLSPFALLEADFAFAGFFDPVMNGAGVVNLANAGRSIPVKWQLRNGSGGFISDLAAVTGLNYQQISCAGSSNTFIMPAEDTLASGNSGLRYDAASNQFIYTWKTDKSMADKCYRLNVGLFHVETRTADFEFE